jgi:4-oxalmesaconate hydratase
MVELDVPAMIHGSSTCNPAFHTTGSHYMNIDNTGIMQLLESRVFQDFPTLRIIMPHGGGVIPYQIARYRALSIMNKWEPFEEFMRRFYFDTAVYSPEAMELLIKIVGVDRLIFASEMLGGVTTIDPNTGRWFDDNKPLLDEIAWLSEEDRQMIFEDNVKAAYPRLGPVMEKQLKAAKG